MALLRAPDLNVGPFRERDTVLITATIRDNAVTPAVIPGSALDSLKWTLYDEKAGTVINSRTQIEAKTLVSSLGVLTLELLPADMVILHNGLLENHRLLFEWLWTVMGVQKRGSYEIRIPVSNVLKVP